MSKVRGIKSYQSCYWTRAYILVYCNSLKSTLTTTTWPGVNQFLLIQVSGVVDKLNQPYSKTPFLIVRNCEIWRKWLTSLNVFRDVIMYVFELMSTSRHFPLLYVSTGLMTFCPSLVLSASLFTLDFIYFLQYKMDANDSQYVLLKIACKLLYTKVKL